MSGIKAEDGLGEVITFYSYKGGTGRSMALVNVACLLAKEQTEGNGVLMIDWDLEAPGLHHFFQNRFSEVAVELKGIGRPFDEMPGLIDLFLTFSQETPDGQPKTDAEATKRAEDCLKRVQVEDYVVSTNRPYLNLMKAGRFDSKYSSRVNKFDWKDMYNRSPKLFRLLARHLTEKYRYVLIDSRTGITDVSGICTALMPQKLVAVFTPNHQSLAGVIDQVKWTNGYRRKSVDLRPLLVFPLPSRIETSEPRRGDAWRLGDQKSGREGYQPLFEKLFKEMYDLSDCDLSGYFDDIQVPHSPAYAYGEEIAVVIERTKGPGMIAGVFRSLCGRISNGNTPWTEMPTVSAAKISEVKAQAAESSRREKAQAVVAFRVKRFAIASTIAAACLVGMTTWLWKTSYTIDQVVLKMKSFFVSIHLEPQMVQVPSGIFKQGDVEKFAEKSNNSVHQVTVKPFYMGKYEVTFDEYDRYAISEGKPLPADQSWGRGRRPVINVSWVDAKDYAKWLSEKTGKHYRLPTESEWEYAARSGEKQQIWAGTNDEHDLNRYAVFAQNSESQTKEVGKNEPNVFGLYDLSGNVFEWVEDCEHGNYENAPNDGSTWLADKEGCRRRGLRGGSWDNVPGDLRASFRGWSNDGSRSSHLGFRLVQDLNP